MLSESDEIGIALEDLRARQSALTTLILFTDRQAMSLLSVYMALGTASASAAIGALGVLGAAGRPVAAALLAETILMIAGAVFCFRAMATARISLPGRGPEFWKRHARSDSSLRHAFADYLESLESAQNRDRVLNERSSRALREAKEMGIVAIGLGVVAGLAATFWSWGA